MTNEEGMAGSGPRIQPEPKLGERFAHIFGVHSWREVEGSEHRRQYCAGCRTERRMAGHFGGRPDLTPPPSTFASEEPESRTSEPEPEPETIPFPRAESRRRSGSSGGATDELGMIWERIARLPIWVKIAGGFVLLNLVGTVVSLFTR